MIFPEYINVWDSLIQKWMKSPCVLHPLLEDGLSCYHLPEPYYGDMNNCSIVIVNLNPGAGQCYQCWYNQNTSETAVYEVKKSGYSDYAKGFPLLSGAGGGTASSKWWESRKKWMERILKCMGVKTYNKPFAIELCPLHSAEFKISNPTAYVKKMKSFNPDLDVVEAIKWAVNHSDAKLGLAIGKSIYNLLLDNGFIDTTKASSYPKPSIHREYRLVENNGVRIMCTWTQGGNTAPASAWRDFESDFIKKNL